MAAWRTITSRCCSAPTVSLPIAATEPPPAVSQGPVWRLADGLSSAFLGAVGAGGQAGPFLEGAVERRRLGKAQLFGNRLDIQVVASQVIDRQIAAQMILEFLKARAFLAHAPAQGLRAAVRLPGHAFQVRPLLAVAAKQTTYLAGQAVARVRAGQQVGGRMLQELFE